MKTLIVLSAFVAVVFAAPSAILAGPLATSSVVQGPSAAIVGPSGSIVSQGGVIATSPAVASVVAPSLLGRSIVIGHSASLLTPGVLGLNTGLIGVPGLVNHHGLGNVIVA